MSVVIGSYVNEVKQALSDAFALTPERDMEEMKAEAIAAYPLPDISSQGEILALAAGGPELLVLVNTDIYQEVLDNGAALLQAAVDEEAYELLNP